MFMSARIDTVHIHYAVLPLRGQRAKILGETSAIFGSKHKPTVITTNCRCVKIVRFIYLYCVMKMRAK